MTEARDEAARRPAATQRRVMGMPLAQTDRSYTYVANGRVATITDANGNVTTYEYDGLYRRATTRYRPERAGQLVDRPPGCSPITPFVVLASLPYRKEIQT